ncbi:hypothetical protein [Corynebacterium epidermidicanis]|uniref:Lipoprotein n=1 Tax=Corynebacterium epidermidicanis TaxID=1050174 RepID=A0A0G3GSB8_9CORY|nr:hypothetical protein [Corynebacterium epidermidicanis]AKK02448.1 hypothetical protein CEPID_02840 [Corynebacterium epidermidicanis]
MRQLPAFPILLALIGASLTACSSPPHDALARLKKEPGTHAILPASELLIDGAQSFIIVCPYIPADTVSELVGGESVKVPSDGYDSVLNSAVSLLADGSVWTQKYARDEVNLCPSGSDPSPTIRPASDLLTFEKHGRGWVLTEVTQERPE